MPWLPAQAVFDMVNKNAMNQVKYCFIWPLLAGEPGAGCFKGRRKQNAIPDLFVQRLRQENVGVKPKRLVIND